MYENLKPGDVIATEKYIVKVDRYEYLYTMTLEKSGAFDYGNSTCMGVQCRENKEGGKRFMDQGYDTRYCDNMHTPELFHEWSLKWLKDYCRPDAVIERAKVLKYYKRMKDEDEEHEITYDEALRTLLGTWRDSDLTRDMLTIQNYIECMCSWIRVDDPSTTMKPMPGMWNLAPAGIEYDEETWNRI